MKKVKAMQGQNIYDITLRAYGSLDGLGLVLQDNPTLSLTDKLVANTLVNVRDTPLDAVRARVMAARNIVPATADNYKLEEWTVMPSVVDALVVVLNYLGLWVFFTVEGNGVINSDGTVSYDPDPMDTATYSYALSATLDAAIVATTTNQGIAVQANDGLSGYSFDSADGLPSDVARWVAEVDGKYVIGTDDGLATAPLLLTPTPTFTNYLSGVDVRHGYVTDEMLYLATDAGLKMWDGSTFTTIDTGDGLPSDDLVHVMVDSRGTIWLSTDADGLVRIVNGNIIITDSTGAIAPTDKPRLMVEDRLGRVFVAFEDDGTRSLLAIIDTVNGWMVLDSDNGILPELTITAMAVDALDNIYIGTTSALHYWNRHPLINI